MFFLVYISSAGMGVLHQHQHHESSEQGGQVALQYEPLFHILKKPFDPYF